ILDVRSIEELQPAEFHEGDIATRQLDLERTAVMRRPEENGLLFQARANLSVLQDTLDDIAGLIRLIANADRFGRLHRLAVGTKILGKAFRGKTDHAVGRGEEWLRRPVVAVERDDLRRRRELNGEVEDVA